MLSIHISSVSPKLVMIVTANTNPAPGAVALPSTKQEEEDDEEPIKCKYMRAAHGYLRWVGRHVQCEHMLYCSPLQQHHLPRHLMGPH